MWYSAEPENVVLCGVELVHAGGTQGPDCRVVGQAVVHSGDINEK